MRGRLLLWQDQVLKDWLAIYSSVSLPCPGYKEGVQAQFWVCPDGQDKDICIRRIDIQLGCTICCGIKGMQESASSWLLWRCSVCWRVAEHSHPHDTTKHHSFLWAYSRHFFERYTAISWFVLECEEASSSGLLQYALSRLCDSIQGHLLLAFSLLCLANQIFQNSNAPCYMHCTCWIYDLQNVQQVGYMWLSQVAWPVIGVPPFHQLLQLSF